MKAVALPELRATFVSVKMRRLIGSGDSGAPTRPAASGATSGAIGLHG
jgi:hypothetical protein